MRALLAHEQALWARDRLDFAALAARVDAVRGPDLVWALRRAAMLAEPGIDRVRLLVIFISGGEREATYVIQVK